jgi:hypothetical protein
MECTPLTAKRIATLGSLIALGLLLAGEPGCDATPISIPGPTNGAGRVDDDQSPSPTSPGSGGRDAGLSNESRDAAAGTDATAAADGGVGDARADRDLGDGGGGDASDGGVDAADASDGAGDAADTLDGSVDAADVAHMLGDAPRYDAD